MLPHPATSSSSSMHPHTTGLLLILITISTAPSLAVGQHHHDVGGCMPAERAALLSFKEDATSDGGDAVLASWHGQDCCRWRGVSCSNRTGHVIKLHLPNPILDPDGYDACGDANALHGKISPSLLSLKRLEHLDLSINCLLGPNGHIPHFLGSMENLRYLNLFDIPFIGRVPSQLGNLSKLQHLDLGSEYPAMYSTDITWLTKLPLLRYLSMMGTDLSRIANWPRTLNMIPSLRVINLAECSLDTANQMLPYLNLTKLEKLDLSLNNLGHSIASSWFWKVTGLKYLSLRMNLHASWLFGKIPDALGNMTSLEVLDLSETNLNETGNLENLCSLQILDLSGNSMNGDIKVFLEMLPRCAWKNMQELQFDGNGFTGTLPNLIGEFSSLSILSLSGNNLVGFIPPEIGNLARLAALDLGNNQLNGNIPTEIGALAALTSLNLAGNKLTGNIPAELGKLRQLINLDLSDNKITGPVPLELMHSTSLMSLAISRNHLSGSVPTQIGSLKNLYILDLSNNNFSGVIMERHFANLESLVMIDLSFNDLKIVLDSDWRPPLRLGYADFASCQVGPRFPNWLQQLRGITRLGISSTGLEDKLPNWFWSTFAHATYLDISNNQISGSLPAHMDGMALEVLHLGSNRLTGSIPSLLTNITLLDISNNSFSGAGVIPSNFRASRLHLLLAYSNRIGGYIPESICKLQELWYLDLSNNLLEGEIPQCFGMQTMQFLLLSNNSLSGKFPAFLQKNTDMTFLDLAWNKFSGRLPTWMGAMRNLNFVLLGHNAFSGDIPVDITNLRYLQYLDLSCNNLSGAIPWHLSNLTVMTKLLKRFMNMQEGYTGAGNMGGMSDIGAGYLGEIFSIVTKGQQLIYGSTIAYFVSIDLSSNSLTGEIPIDITSLVGLMNLNLSSNNLSGQIPNMIGSMQSLVSLDLSENRLSGQIPSSLSSLTSLADLNLSYNSLCGKIPSGRQLDTLNADNPSLMYIGNSGLCGPPLHNNCSGNDPVNHGNLGSNKQEFEALTFHFGLVLGLVVGLWIVFCVLLFKKTWRIIYFRLFDKVYDRVYVFVVVRWASFIKNMATE